MAEAWIEDDVAVITEVTVKGVTSEGIWVQGEVFESLFDVWDDVFITETQIDEDSDLDMSSEEGDEGELRISTWFVDRKGWREALEH
jgi:hypothetical protein